jgi:hypothetical protein
MKIGEKAGRKVCFVSFYTIGFFAFFVLILWYWLDMNAWEGAGNYNEAEIRLLWKNTVGGDHMNS